jgi:hypothetical protein
VGLWYIGRSSHDRAVETARETCRRQGVQFLDGTAVLKSVRPAWSRTEGPALERTYTFDYSEDGVTRLSGCIVMRNFRVTAILLDG